MGGFWNLLLAAIAALCTTSSAMTLVNSDDGGDGRLMKDDVIKTDICTIGGGASGTYAAVRLHDLGQKVLLIEREAVLGGRTNTYIDPQTNQTVDYGVESIRTLPVVEEYFQHLGISYNKIPSSSSGITSLILISERARLCPTSDNQIFLVL